MMIPPQKPNYIPNQPAAPGGGGGIEKQLLGMGLKAGLQGSPLAPMAGFLGGLFNEGGKVPWWKKVKNTVWGTGPKKGSIADQINWGGQKKNMGGPISANPHGYNEGGAVMETPIKKVMDEQKLEQQAMAFDLEQKRKQETHEQAMRQKEAQFKEAQKMKKAAATTSKQPAKPKGPLGG